MTPERWNEIKALFSSAWDCPPDERAQFLIRACGADKELKREVENLLEADRDDGFLQNSAVAEAASLFEDEKTAELGTVSDAGPRFETGTLLAGRYEIVRMLGRGGMGEVYLAADTRINRNVAVKVIHSDTVSSKEALRRFALEAQAVSALNHPHIMTIYEVDSATDGTLFFVAEYIEGQTLNHRIGPELTLEKALDIAIQVASALSAAHEAGITHRDIKPENIMVRHDGYVKVLDFGLAKLGDRESSSLNSGSEDPTQALQRTRPGAVIGTAAYMSPEQARGRDVDARADVWSLAVVLYEMITGQRPFSGETSADIIVSVLTGEARPMSAYVRDLPTEIDWIISKALTKNVDGRYQTIKGLRADLERVKKRIEFDETLRSADGHSRADQERAAQTVEQPVPTADGGALPTSAGRGGPAFLSSPSFEAVLRQAQTHRVSSSIAGLALIALISTGLYLVFISSPAGAHIDSIAVLPFQNLTGNPDVAYVCDGLSETLIDRLSQLRQLRVISRNSSFKFRDPNIDVGEVASQLGVRAVLTGSVSKVGDELAIRIDIVDAAENRHLTGGQYRRRADDLMRIQTEIAQATADQLQLKLTDEQTARLKENGTGNSDAYRYYLNGISELNNPLLAQSKALEYFEQAVKLDPEFAPAHAEMAWVYYSKANSSGDPSEIMPKAKAAAERALALDPDLAKAHAVRAMLNEYEFDWPGAEREYERAIELSPNLDFARNNFAFFLSVMGRHEEALVELEEQRVRDPLNLRMMLLHKAIVLVQARRFDDALAAYRDAQAADPTKGVPNSALAYAYAGKGLYNEAAAYYRKSVDLVGGPQEYSQSLVYLAATYAKMPEKRGEARAILSRIEANSRYASPALLAVVYASLNENDKAIELLERAYIRRDILLRFIRTGYEYDPLRDDPRFADLLKRIGLGS